MGTNIFYSWQTDSPSAINRNFIESALNKAIRQLAKDISLEEALREEIKLDKDTSGIPGIPEIANTIFDKISACGIFVPDLTFIGKTKEGRHLQNPNVLIEYGWALKEVTKSRMIPVMNATFGEPSNETLPFDMRHLRHPITYNLDKDTKESERTKIKEQLVKDLSNAIKTIMEADIIPSKNDLIKKEPVYKEVPTTSKPSIFFTSVRDIVEPRIYDQTYSEQFQRNSHLFLRLIPSNPITPKLGKTELDTCAINGNLRPMAAHTTDTTHGISKDGCYKAIIDDITGDILGYTHLFKSGELWGIDAYSIDKERLMESSGINFGFFPCVAIEDVFVFTLNNYLTFAKETLKLKPPFKFIAGATQIKDFRMATTDMFQKFDGHVYEKNILYDGEIQDFDIEPVKILRPFFDHLWDECGLKRPDKDRLI